MKYYSSSHISNMNKYECYELVLNGIEKILAMENSMIGSRAIALNLSKLIRCKENQVFEIRKNIK